MRVKDCLRCAGEMTYLRTEKLQLGQTGWILGDLPNLLAGALAVEIYVCKDCGKLEFYLANEEEEAPIPQRKCPHCGQMHDFDAPRCPYCKYEYYKR